MGDFEILSLTETNKWNSYLKQLPLEQQDIYFTPEYYQLYEELGDGKAHCFVFKKNNDTALYPFLLNSINKLGYDLNKEYFDIQGAYGYNGIISSSYEESFISSFYSAFDNYIFNNNIIVEFTRFHSIIKNYLFPIGMDIIKDRETIILNITKEYGSIWNNSYSSVNRNMIRKAIKHNISISISTQENDYENFFNIYKQTMNNIGSDEYYYFSKQYFKNFYLLLNNNHKLILAKIGDEIICSMILMHYGQYAHYHLSGRLKEFSNTGVNNLILDQAIKIAQKEGCIWFHFGGGNTNKQTDPLLKFKSNFSKDTRPFHIGKKIHNKIVYDKVVNQWTEKFIAKVEKYNRFALKYRY